MQNDACDKMQGVAQHVRGAFVGYAAVWMLSVAAFWLIAGGSNAMGYSLVFIWTLNPMAIAVASIYASVKGWPGLRAWALAAAFGFAYMLLPYMTFSLANTLAVGNVHVPDLGMFVAGAAVSFVGLGIGALVARRRS